MPETLVTEAVEAAGTATPTNGAVFLIDLITPGWGSSGYYSADVLEQAAKDRVFPAGTLMYINHQTAQERNDRPEGDLRDLAAVLQEDAIWTGESLQAKSRVFSSWREPLKDMKDEIGVSIRASADVGFGDAEGRNGRIIERLVNAQSVDFVTQAGRGGRIVDVLEAARVEEARNIGQWIESRIHRDFTITADDMAGAGRLTREERIGLSGAIGDALQAFVTRLEAEQPQLYTRDLYDDPADTVATALEALKDLPAKRAAELATARGLTEATANQIAELLRDALKEKYGADKTYVWTRDYDATTVWFERESPGSAELLQQTFSLSDDGVLTLTGTPIEVRQVTTYVPVSPAGQSTTQESKEDTMPEIEEARLRQLEEDAGRVTALESARDEAVKERDEVRKELAEARDAARESTVARIIAEADADFSDLESAGLQALAVKHTEDGVLEESKFKTAVDEAAAAKKVAEGAGRVRGNGQRTQVEDNVTEAQLDELDDAVFGKVKEA